MALALARKRLPPRRLDFVLLFGVVEFALSFWFSGFCARALKSKPKLETAKTTATRTIIERKLFLLMDLLLPCIFCAHFRNMRQDRINRCQGDQSQPGGGRNAFLPLGPLNLNPPQCQSTGGLVRAVTPPSLAAQTGPGADHCNSNSYAATVPEHRVSIPA